MKPLSKSIKVRELEMSWSLAQPSNTVAAGSEHQVNRCWFQESICVLKCIKAHSFPPNLSHITDVFSCFFQTEWWVFIHQKPRLYPNVPVMTSQQVCVLLEYLWWGTYYPRSSRMKSLIPKIVAKFSEQVPSVRLFLFSCSASGLFCLLPRPPFRPAPPVPSPGLTERHLCHVPSQIFSMPHGSAPFFPKSPIIYLLKNFHGNEAPSR